MPRRALSELEVPYVVTGTTSSGSFTVRGPLDAQRMAAAFAALRREQPVLTGVIEAGATGFELVVPERAVDETHAPVTVEQRSFAPGDVRLDADPQRSIAALAIASDGDLHRVTLGVSHAVADGAHAVALNLRLWELYTDPHDERTPAPALPHAPTDLAGRLPAAQAPEPLSITARTCGNVPEPSAVNAGEFGFERIRLSAEDTTALRERAKAAGLSVHGLLAGLIVTAERAAMPVDPQQPVPMAVFSPVDLRGRCEPPVGATEVTNFAGSSTAPLTVCADTPATEIGQAVLQRLRADLADGSAASALTGTAAVTVTDGAPVRLSNLGTVPPPSTPQDVTALDFNTSSEVDIDRVRALVQGAPPQLLAPLVGLHYHALTFDGRLSIEMRHAPGTLAPQAVAAIRSAIESALTATVAV
ncbi:acyltransferase [Tsukamurella serpentis]